MYFYIFFLIKEYLYMFCKHKTVLIIFTDNYSIRMSGLKAEKFFKYVKQ